MLFVRKFYFFIHRTILSYRFFSNSLYKDDVLYQGDTRDLPEYQSQPDIPTYIQETTTVPETNEKSAMKPFWDVFMKMTNFNVLNDKKMVIICLVR